MTDGSYDCQCPRGWQKIGYPPKCLDIDECVLYNPCLVGYCVNTKGSYSCKCPKVFQFDTAAGHCIHHAHPEKAYTNALVHPVTIIHWEAVSTLTSVRLPHILVLPGTT